MLVPSGLIICMRYLGTSICRRLLKLTQQRREVNRPQRVDGCFPTSFRTEALHTRVLVCLKDRLEACFSDTFGEIFQLHIAPRKNGVIYKKNVSILPGISIAARRNFAALWPASAKVNQREDRPNVSDRLSI